MGRGVSTFDERGKRGAPPGRRFAIDGSLERLVVNQSLVREVNERIFDVHGEAKVSEFAEFLCECSRDACIDVVPMTLEEYEGVRSGATLFLVRPGHELEEIEHVLDRNDRFVLVEKRVGTRFAVLTDPRSGQHPAPE